MSQIESASIFDAIPDELDEELVESILQGKNVRVERIVSQGHASPDTGWYDQEWHEWVFVVQGEAVIRYHEGGEIRLRAGCHLNIPAHTRHKVAWTAPDVKTIWLAVFYRADDNNLTGN